MDSNHALIVFSALSQETRLKVMRLLVEYGTTGTPAGTLSERLGIPHNTLSFHLSHLSDAGLVTACKQGRSIIYCADYKTVQALSGFMLENCCIHQEEACCPPPSKQGAKS